MKLIWAIAIAALLAGSASAQVPQTVRIAGFTPATTGTPISVTTGGVSGTLPAGITVIASNVGATNIAYCKLGASATTSDQAIQPGSWFAFTPGSATQLTCITSTSATTVNMVGGSGLPSGAGGGGSSGGGGGGAVTIADGADVNAGAVADAAATAGSTGTGSAKLRFITSILNTISSNIAAAIPAGTALIGKVGFDPTTPGTTNGVSLAQVNAATTLAGNGATGTGSQRVTMANDNTIPTGWPSAANQTSWQSATGAAVPANAAYHGVNVGGNIVGVVGDPCQTNAKTYTPISITAATTTRIVSPTASKRTYVCYLFLTSAAADNVGIVEGTGGTCGTGTAGVLGGTTAANGPNFAANGGTAIGTGGFAAIATAGTNVDLCLITSAATPLAGHVTWVQAP